MSVEFINWYWIYSANIWGIYVIWRVSVRPSGAGLGNISGQECTFSYMYTCIGYKLPTFGEYMLVGGFLCALRAQGWGICLVRNVHFLICIPDNFPPDKFHFGQVPPGQDDIRKCTFLTRHITQPCARRAHRNPPTDIHSRNVGSLYPIPIYFCYKMSVEFINWYWIYSANMSTVFFSSLV